MITVWIWLDSKKLGYENEFDGNDKGRKERSWIGEEREVTLQTQLN